MNNQDMPFSSVSVSHHTVRNAGTAQHCLVNPPALIVGAVNDHRRADGTRCSQCGTEYLLQRVHRALKPGEANPWRLYRVIGRFVLGQMASKRKLALKEPCWGSVRRKLGGLKANNERLAFVLNAYLHHCDPCPGGVDDGREHNTLWFDGASTI